MTEEIRFITITDSTNSDAMGWAVEGATHGCAIVSEQQQSGRGRLGRPWFSPKGTNLYSSIIIRPKLKPQEFPKLALVAGLAVAEVLKSHYHLAPGLKWPNDIFLNDKKCGGILCESSLSAKEASENFAVIGIGLNVNMDFCDLPDELRNNATSLLMEGIAETNPRALFFPIRDALLQFVKDFENDGFKPILDRWGKYDFLKGKVTRWVTDGGVVVKGLCMGPDENGLLHIVDNQGRQHLVVSGDVGVAGE